MMPGVGKLPKEKPPVLSFKLTMKPLLPLAIALGSGVMMGLTPSPVNAWPLAWVALGPLWVLLVNHQHHIRDTRLPRNFLFPYRLPLLYGLLWGIGFHGIAIFWITGIHPMTWMGVPWLASLAIALFAWGFLALWGGGTVALWAGVFQWVSSWDAQSRGVWCSLVRVLMGTALWCGLETLQSMSPLFWTSLAYTQSPFNLVILHLGQLSGPITVTASIVAVNGLLAEAWMQLRVNRDGAKAQILLFINGALSLTLCLAGWGLYSLPLNDAMTASIQVGLIQGNIPNTIKLYEDGWRRALAGYTDGYRTLADQGVDVVLTPETALPIQWTEPWNTRTALYQAILQEGVPIWVGAFGGDGRTITNSVFTVAGDGTTLSEYRKAKLVPLGEYIPFERWVGGLINRLSPLDAHMIPGTFDQQFDTPFGRAIAAICYESAFPQIFRRQASEGGEFIITASNNAHYSPTMPAQHHAQDVMRAIETDRWAARATNTGYSGIVDPHGRTLWISDINTYEIHADTIYRRQTQTLYVRWGNWLTPVLLIVGVGVGWIGLLNSR